MLQPIAAVALGTGDFNGDADLLFQKSDGTDDLDDERNLGSRTATLANPGGAWNAIGTATTTATADILFQNVDGTPLIWTMNGTSVTATATLANPGIHLHANTG